MTTAAAPKANVTPGVVPAWAVTFSTDPPSASSLAPFTVGSAAYDGSVSATLPSGLTGGSYQVVIEGMTDSDYQKLLRLASGRLRAALHLWWLDASPSILGDLARFTGLASPLGPATVSPPPHSQVADLRIDKVTRRAGERRYEVTVTGRERVVARLGEAQVGGACYPDLDTAVQAVAGAAGITVTTYEVADIQPDPNQPGFADTTPGRALNAMNTLADQVKDARQLAGLPPTMIRDGALHLGKWTGAAAAPGPGVSRGLDEGSGLVAIERGDEHGILSADLPPGAPPPRGTVVVTALGRPDIKPGDTLSLLLPPTDFPALEPPSDGAALLTALTGLPADDTGPAGDPSRCLVAEVRHQISRRQGFVTVVRATVLGQDDDGWDKRPDGAFRPDGERSPRHGTVSADPAAGAASAVRALVRNSITDTASPVRPRIAQIHDHAASGVPRHTSIVRYSTAPPDGLPVAAQRTTIDDKTSGELKEVPYLTPFGWGHFGLVLPRYPGTRVLLASAGGGPGDLIDLGSVWERDSGPPSQPGDYWLVLPVGVSAREHLSGDGAASDGPASHDLTDGDGNRIIETTRFVVRVTDQPTHSGARPDPTSDSPPGSVLIETKPGSGSGASIQLKDDGSVTITASGISLDAGRGDISLTANNVTVKVTGTMDVS